MSNVSKIWKGALSAFFCFAATLCFAEIGFDTGMDAPTLAARLGINGTALTPSGSWIRVRGVADPKSATVADVVRNRTALDKLHRDGFRVCVFLMPSGKSWSSGTRALPEANLPLDLREAHDWIERLAKTYRGLVDEWEIGDEPDIGFLGENAENYSAFLKACYWGAGSRVLMAPLAMPPGPYLQGLIRNELLSYTDGFNYHYYGYAGDFTGVYRQFEKAAGDSDGGPTIKHLPVFVTEFGYGMLGAEVRGTIDGRVRQWRWFRTVAPQVEALRVEGPMAFLLSPYLERRLNEFGLTMLAPEANALTFTPQDFGKREAEPWMALIGRRMGIGEASPALAYLIDYGKKHPYVPRTWTIRIFPPSPVVLDFVAGPEILAVKASQGYILLGKTPSQCMGSGELHIYNFSDRTVTGHLAFYGGVTVLAEGGSQPKIELEPEGMRVLPVHLIVPSVRWQGRNWNVAFIPDEPEEGGARFSAQVYPDGAGMRRTVVADFNHREAQALLQRSALLAMPLAEEEPVLRPNGRWLVTTGMAVRELGGTWKFRIDRLPNTALRPAVAELPLPDAFVVPQNSLLLLELRCLSAGAIFSRYAGLSTAQGGLMQVQIRTTNGNLYEVWPRRMPTAFWQTYQEAAENFTMSFYGRANLPWRLCDNKPVALVLTFWPRTLPTEIEIKPTGFVQLGK